MKKVKLILCGFLLIATTSEIQSQANGNADNEQTIFQTYIITLSISPSGEEILFSANFSGGFDLYKSPAGRGEISKFLDLPGMESQTSYSPDGSRIAFSSNLGNGDGRGAASEIFVVNSDGTNLKKLTNHATNAFDVKFTPDGKGLVYAKQKNADAPVFEIYKYDFEQESASVLFTDSLNLVYPSYNSNMDKMVIQKGPQQSPNIYIYDLDSGDQVNITKNSAYNSWPSWSPDGSKILYGSNGEEGTFSLYIYDTDTKETKKLTTGDKNYFAPVWAPDGNSVISIRAETTSSEIVRISTEGII